MPSKLNWTEFKSDIDIDSFFLAQTPSAKAQLEKQYPGRAIYLPFEIPFMKKLDEPTKKKIHMLKKEFGGLVIDYMKKDS